MQINEKDLGKIVQLPVRPEWGPGIISKIENRFASILFRSAEEKTEIIQPTTIVSLVNAHVRSEQTDEEREGTYQAVP